MSGQVVGNNKKVTGRGEQVVGKLLNVTWSEWTSSRKSQNGDGKRQTSSRKVKRSRDFVNRVLRSKRIEINTFAKATHQL